MSRKKSPPVVTGLSGTAPTYPDGFSGCSLGCEFNGARFHLWLDKAGQPVEPLYQNPPLGTDAYLDRAAGVRNPGYYRTRKLTLGGPIGRVLVPVLMSQRDALVAAAHEARAQEEAKRRTDSERAARLMRVKESGPQLLAALERFDLTCHADPANPCRLSGDPLKHWGGGESCPACQAALTLERVRP